MVGITIFEFLSWLFDKLKTLRTSIEVWTTDLLVGESASYCKVWQRSDIGIEYVPICVDRLTHPTHTLQPTIHCHFGLSALDCRLLQVTESNNRLEKKTGETEPIWKKNTLPTNLQSTAAPMSFFPISMNFLKPPHPALPVKVIQNSTGASWRGLLPRLVHSWIPAKSWSWFLDVQSLRSGPTKWALSYEWNYNPYRWPYNGQGGHLEHKFWVT